MSYQHICSHFRNSTATRHQATHPASNTRKAPEINVMSEMRNLFAKTAKRWFGIENNDMEEKQCDTQRIKQPPAREIRRAIPFRVVVSVLVHPLSASDISTACQLPKQLPLQKFWRRNIWNGR